MFWLVSLVLGPVIAGIILAVAWWLIWGRRNAPPATGVGASFLAAGLLLVLGGAATRLMGLAPLLPIDMPSEVWDWYWDYRFTTPMLLGILGMVVLAFPVRARNGKGAASLAPRTPLSFARRRWFATPAVVLALILIATVAAGGASQPDPATGNYTMYFVDLGGQMGMGTSIYGWFYSTPSLIVMGAMIAVAIFDLFLIARPALGVSFEGDAQIRTLRTRNVLAVGTGAFLIHLGAILGSLAGTASLRAGFGVSEGYVTFWTTFAALEPVLSGASHIAAALGVAFWVTVGLTALPSPRRAPAAVGS